MSNSHAKMPVFTGASVAIITPFTQDGNVNYEKLGELIEQQIAGGTAAITICGTTGESATLNDEEHRGCVEYCVKKVAGKIKVIAGTGSNDTAYAISLSKFAEKAGADGLLMVTPYYNKTSQRGLVKHFTAVADAVNTPIILYNVPSRTGLSFVAETYLELSKHPNINGVKEASGDFSLIARTRHLCGDDLFIWSGNDDQAIPIMSLGGKGVISVVSNVAPQIMSRMCALCFDGKFTEAAKLQIDTFDLAHDLFLEVNPIPVKTAMNLMGMDVGGLRLPLCEMSDEHTEILRNTLVRMGLLK